MMNDRAKSVSKENRKNNENDTNELLSKILRRLEEHDRRFDAIDSKFSEMKVYVDKKINEVQESITHLDRRIKKH